MKRFITNKYFLYIVGIVLVLALWFLISSFFDNNSIIFPNPIDTIKEMFILLGKRITYINIGYSLLRMIIGFSVSFAIALLLGAIAGNNPHFYTIFTPLMSTLKTIPTASVVFLFIVLSGARNAPIYVVILICLPILYEAIVGGIKNISNDVIQASRVDGSSALKSLIHIKLPLSIPYIIVGISSSFSLSFKIEIMAEIITGYTKDGLGVAIRSAQVTDPTNMTPIFAISLIAIILMFIMSFANKLLKKKIP